MKRRNMKIAKVVLAIGMAAAMACACAETDYETYEFETYDGRMIVIDESNIISQEQVEDVLESELVPADAEVIAPGRDFVYLEDADHYYVEDVENGLLTIATKTA